MIAWLRSFIQWLGLRTLRPRVEPFPLARVRPSGPRGWRRRGQWRKPSDLKHRKKVRRKIQLMSRTINRRIRSSLKK